MKKWTEVLLEMIERNDLYDPWIDNIDLGEAISEVEEEIEELKVAWKRNDIEEMSEEIGDLIWTAFIVVLVASRRGIDPETVVKKLKDKMKRRKPYIFTGTKPSLEEAVKIWRRAKESE